MAFGMSLRFNKNTKQATDLLYKPSSAFNAPHHCPQWIKPQIFGHKCTENCSDNLCNAGYKNLHAAFVKKHRRQSLDACKSNNFDNNLDEVVGVKKELKAKMDDKENCIPQKTSGRSSIPKLRKPPTEGHAPSFVTNPRHSVHNCNLSEPGPSKTNFDRHSLQRKSIKPIRKPVEKMADDKMAANMSEDSLETPKLIGRKLFNVSYTKLPAGIKQGEADNATDDMKESSFKQEEPKSHDIFALNDCDMLFLIKEEFIDDEYDSYLKEFDGGLNKELYEMARCLVKFYLGKRPFTKKKVKRAKKVKRRRSANVWKAVVEEAISHLKDEFQSEIYHKTSEKVDDLLRELKQLMVVAQGDISSTCDEAKANLITRLENLVLKM